MLTPNGPGSPFELLFADDAAEPASLPEAYRQIYPGDWRMPKIEGKPYTFSNFGQSRDGRISFNEPGSLDASFVTKADPHDRWLMGLLRARAHAVIVGDTTVNLESGHFWTPDFICPGDGDAFNDLRQREGYAPIPILVILSYAGNVNFAEICFKRRDLQVVLATTSKGAAAVSDIQVAAHLDVLDLGDKAADLHRLMAILYSDYGVRHLLCEGGAHVFAGLLDAGLIDEEFVTWCPTFVGRSASRFRPSYTEGVAWMPDSAPYSKPVSLHRAGDYLFMRTRCLYRK
jgi:riboflavin biosynthesis pyrimidine reductase